MNYNEWLRVQLEDHGLVRKPVLYKMGQWRAIQELMHNKFNYKSKVLDFGCAEGAGILYMHYIGFDDVIGYDVNQNKVNVANQLGVRAFCRDIARYPIQEMTSKFDVIWTSHSLEHVHDPEMAVHNLRGYLRDKGHMVVILPYVDTGDEGGHPASKKIGLRENDNGKTVESWFSRQGFIVKNKKFSQFRESEIWLTLEKE